MIVSMADPGWRAVETIYHSYLTSLILHSVTRRRAADAAELVFRRITRRVQQ